jgi:hypothetical protein
MAYQMDSKILRLEKRYKGLARVTSAINDLYIYGIFEQNFPDLTKKCEEAKDACKKEITETKRDIRNLTGINIQEDQPTDPLRRSNSNDD